MDIDQIPTLRAAVRVCSEGLALQPLGEFAADSLADCVQKEISGAIADCGP
jgi:hypothetical protein